MVISEAYLASVLVGTNFKISTLTIAELIAYILTFIATHKARLAIREMQEGESMGDLEPLSTVTSPDPVVGYPVPFPQQQATIPFPQQQAAVVPQYFVAAPGQYPPGSIIYTYPHQVSPYAVGLQGTTVGPVTMSPVFVPPAYPGNFQ
jgi:hypothetical protein